LQRGPAGRTHGGALAGLLHQRKHRTRRATGARVQCRVERIRARPVVHQVLREEGDR
jgi:hypothetical protein